MDSVEFKIGLKKLRRNEEIPFDPWSKLLNYPCLPKWLHLLALPEGACHCRWPKMDRSVLLGEGGRWAQASREAAHVNLQAPAAGSPRMSAALH